MPLEKEERFSNINRKKREIKGKLIDVNFEMSAEMLTIKLYSSIDKLIYEKSVKLCSEISSVSIYNCYVFTFGDTFQNTKYIISVTRQKQIVCL
jgi:hypothetical protein